MARLRRSDRGNILMGGIAIIKVNPFFESGIKILTDKFPNTLSLCYDMEVASNYTDGFTFELRKRGH